MPIVYRNRQVGVADAAIDESEFQDWIGVQADLTPDGGVTDQSVALQAILDAAPMGSMVRLPSYGIIRASSFSIPTGVSMCSNGCKLYAGNIKFKPAAAQEFNTVLRDIWFKRCTFDISGEGDTGTSSGGNTTLTLKDTTKNWTPNQFVNYFVQITAGTGTSSATHVIVSNTTDTLTLRSVSPFAVIPDNTSTYVIKGYVSAVVFDHCFIDGTDLNNTGTFIGTTVGATAQVNAFTIGNFGFDVHFVNGTRMCNYQGWGIDIHGNSSDDLTGTAYLATGVFVTASDTKIFNMGGRSAIKTSTTNTNTTVVNSVATLPINYYAGWTIRILTGAGAGQVRIVESNTADTFTILSGSPFTTVPGNGATFDLFCGGGIRFLGGPADGGSLHLANVLIDHVQTGLWIDDAAAGVPTSTPTGSGGITVLANNLRIETCGNLGGGSIVPVPVIYNARGNVTINGLWYSNDVAIAAYKNIWHRSGEMTISGGRFITGLSTAYAVYCDPNFTCEFDIPCNNPYSIGAVKPIRTFESASGSAYECDFRFKLTKVAGDSGTASTTGTTTTLIDTTKNWTTDQFKNCLVTITGGTGSGTTQYQILSNTATQLTLSGATYNSGGTVILASGGTFSQAPTATSTYTIAGALTCQNVVANGVGFGLGNNAAGDQWSSAVSPNIANNSTSVNVTSNAFNTVFYVLNGAGNRLTVSLANRQIKSAISASIAGQSASIAGLYADVQLLLVNGLSNFSILFKDAAGADVNLASSMATGKTVEVYCRIACQRG